MLWCRKFIIRWYDQTDTNPSSIPLSQFRSCRIAMISLCPPITNISFSLSRGHHFLNSIFNFSQLPILPSANAGSTLAPMFTGIFSFHLFCRVQSISLSGGWFFVRITVEKTFFPVFYRLEKKSLDDFQFNFFHLCFH